MKACESIRMDLYNLPFALEKALHVLMRVNFFEAWDIKPPSHQHTPIQGNTPLQAERNTRWVQVLYTLIIWVHTPSMLLQRAKHCAQLADEQTMANSKN
jgi:hypothetical protein